MKRLFSLITALLTVAMFTGCYETILYNTNHPETGQIIVYIEQPTLPDGTDVPGDLYVVIDGDILPVDDDGYVVFPDDFEPGTYTAYVFNDPDSIDVHVEDGNIIASVNETSVAGVIESLPGLLYFGTETFTVTEDGVTVTSISMYQISCVVNFELELDGDAIDRIENITALLNGIIQKWDCINDVPYGTGYSIAPELVQGTTSAATSVVRTDITRAEDGEKDILSGTIYILGIDPDSKQELTITLDYLDENPTSHTAVSDISDWFSGVNDNKSVAIQMEGSMSTPIGSVTGGAIIDWGDEAQPNVTIK